jgi:antitoxin component YwqK of YwqJK toxin-antitoxin module
LQAEEYIIGGKHIGVQKLYHFNGKIFYISNYDKYGMKDGETLLYGKNGVRVAKVRYRKNKKDGLSEIYDKKGALKIKTNYSRGEKHGVEDTCLAKENTILRKIYKNGKLVKKEYIQNAPTQ